MSYLVRHETWVTCDSCANSRGLRGEVVRSVAVAYSGYIRCCEQDHCPDCAPKHTRKEHGAGRPL